MKTRTLWLAALLALPLTAFGQDMPDWKKELQPEDDSWKEAEQVLIFNNGSEPETLDPAIMTGVLEGRLAGGLFEGLVTHHPETLEPLPGVAESWTVSDDAKVYTFKLRKTSRWTDGTTVTARDFFASWKRVLEPETTCQYAYMLYPVAGAKAFNKAGSSDEYPKGVAFDTVGIKVVDDFTLQVTLERPCAYFLDLIAFHTLLPVPVKVIEKHKEKWVRPENIVTNGPFELKEWLLSQRVVLEKSDTYWDKDFVKLQKVVALPFDDNETVYKLFKQGKCDWMTTIPQPKIDEIKRLPEYYAMEYLGSYYYKINVTKPPFDDVRVRKALSLGFDREVITRDILKAGQIPATWYTPKMPNYTPPKGLAYNRAEARRLLADAGYPEGKGFPEVDLLYNTNEAHKAVAEQIVQQWKENLGIRVSLRNSEWKVYLNDQQHLQYQISRAGWIGDYTDPNTFLDMWVTGGGNNNTGWGSPKYDKLIDDAAKESDPKKRAKIFYEAEQMLIEKEFPIIPIYIYVNQGVIKEKVAGWYENVRDQHPLKYIYIEPVD